VLYVSGSSVVLIVVLLVAVIAVLTRAVLGAEGGEDDTNPPVTVSRSFLVELLLLLAFVGFYAYTCTHSGVMR
jgi:hypothetical protein